MTAKKVLEIVSDDAGFVYRGIQTARTSTTSHDIPNRDAGGLQRFHAHLVIGSGVESQDFAEDAPELIAGVGVVLAGLQ